MMKYRTIIEINQSVPDLTLNIVEEEDEALSILPSVINTSIIPNSSLNASEGQIQMSSGNIEDIPPKIIPIPLPRTSRSFSKLFKRKSCKKYDLWKSEQRRSVSEGDLVGKFSTCSSTSPQLIQSFRKKNPDSWLVVQKLKIESDGGILDPDDKLTDVVDDREQIMAIYEEDPDGIPSLQHVAGDGTSASSVGTSSPDIFQNTDHHHKFQAFTTRTTDIEITDEELLINSNHHYSHPHNNHHHHGSGGGRGGSPGGVTLQVRRGSEPALNRFSPPPLHLSPLDQNFNSKRWSAAPIIDEDSLIQSSNNKSGDIGNYNVGEISINTGSQLSVSSSSRENSVIFNYHNLKGPSIPSNNVSSKFSSGIQNNMTAVPNLNHHHHQAMTPKRGHSLSNQNHGNSDQNGMTSTTSNYSLPTTSCDGLVSPSGTSIPSIPTIIDQSNQLPTSTTSVQMRQAQPSSSNLGIPSSSRFSRDGNRLSMQFTMDGRWVDAADRALFLSTRKEPVGAPTSVPSTPFSDSIPVITIPPQLPFTSTPDSESQISDTGKSENTTEDEEIIDLILKYETGPLGIHLIPEYHGLIIQGVEPGGRIDRDGRLKAQDKIIEINGNPLLGIPFQQAQTLFREGLTCPELRLKIIISPQSHATSQAKITTNHVQQLVSKFNGDLTEEKENMIQGQERIIGEAKVATLPTSRKTSPAPLQSVPLRQSTTSLISANTRKIGRKYEIGLQKGAQGLGFSITTRDNPAGGNCPIYIKNILPTGAAVDDGRLRPGDRLLEVNGIEITGKSQTEAVSILRNIPQGGIVKLLVSRQERIDLSPKLPRQIPPEKATDDIPSVTWSEREILYLDIPVLDTEKAGLGISVKGKTTSTHGGAMLDNGIYIKSVINGGAASRDGRLRPNDQLLSVNDVSLLDRPNTDAMETLRKTMTQDGPKPKPGFITLKIARRVPSSSAPTTDMSAYGSSASGDEMESWGSRNISYSADGSRGKEYEDNSTNPINGRREKLSLTVNDNHFNSQNESNTNFSQSNNYYNRNSLRRKTEPIPNCMQDPRSTHPYLYNSGPTELTRNPVVERLTGKGNLGAVRSESYYRATNEPAGNNPLVPSPMSPGFAQPVSDIFPARNKIGEVVLIENDYSPPSKPPRSSSTPENVLGDRKGNLTTGSDMSTSVISQPGQIPGGDVTYASQTSLEEDVVGFARDAFGRQSMSEKRHASLDAKGTDTYQRNKKLREERERQRKLQVQQEITTAKPIGTGPTKSNQDRRGIKRPLTCSNEVFVNYQLQNGDYGFIGSKNERRKSSGISFGSQLRELLYHWNLRKDQAEIVLEQKSQQDKRRFNESAFLLDCFACGTNESPSSKRSDAVTIQRVGSTDSLVESLKNYRGQMVTISTPHKTTHHHHPVDDTRRTKKNDIGPSLGMKKSSSLESLQTMVQEIQIQEDEKAGYGPLRSGPVPIRVIRGRGCNESFRQAVDRSYEAPLGDYENEMETLAEEETESCISGTINHSTQPQQQSTELDNENIYGKKIIPGGKKKPGLFKGLGSMFRFGRHRKSIHGTLSPIDRGKVIPTPESDTKVAKEESEQIEINKARQAAQAENQRIQEQYRRLVDRQKEGNLHQNSPYGFTVSISNKIPSGYSTTSHIRPENGNLRPNHPFRKSMDHYRGGGRGGPTSRSMERDSYGYSQQSTADVNGNTPSHLRSASYDLYNEITRPGSRVGYVDPKKYSHYINYDEIRQHLNRNSMKSTNSTGHNNNQGSGGFGKKRLTEEQLRQMKNTVVEQRKKAILESRRHQQHYHSQRRENPRDRHDRPVSNFYEYESVQAANTRDQGISLAPGSSQLRPPQHAGQPIFIRHPLTTTNNGVTLPSPSTLPFNPAASLRVQRSSSSQFQPVQSYAQPFYATRQQQFMSPPQPPALPLNSPPRSQNQNSLPKRSQGGHPPPPQKKSQQQQQQHSINSFQTGNQTNQPSNLGLPAGRYSMTHSISSTNSHTHTQTKTVTQQQPQCTQMPPNFTKQSTNHRQQFVIGQSNYQHQSHQPQNAHPGQVQSLSHRTLLPSTTSLGSKV